MTTSFWRSWLFAPANRPAIVAKALAGSAHAVVIDLEDAVPSAEKVAARGALADMIDGAHPALFVRINGLEAAEALGDILAVSRLPIAGVMLPKAESARDIQILDWLLDQQERIAPTARRRWIVPLIETAAGLAQCRDIAMASSRILCLAFGAADFTLDLGLRWSRDELELLAVRSALVLESRNAGLAPPLDSVWVDMADSEGLALSSARACDHGFQGKMCIHPNQIAAVHQAFAPTAEMLAQAHRIVAAYADAGVAEGAAIRFEGRMIDLPIVAQARQLIRRAEAIDVRL